MIRISIILFAMGWFAGCRYREPSESKLFTRMNPSLTGIDFINRIEDTDRLNIIKYLYFYNGGGVAVGDINNDGLPDIYFTSNLESNKLYLNQGNFRFKDITRSAGVGGSDNWTTGVTMADVNGDGWLDIYVCEVGGFLQLKGKNRLYINNGDLTFTERGEEFNLDFSGFATHASFFDYDRDGDLDVYLLNHSVHANYTFADLALRYSPDKRSGDKLMRNDGGNFTDITESAGILTGSLGYGLSVSVSDFNQDGWMDIYVCNDFRENDYLYINNQDGTFRQVIEQSMPHTSRFSMGSDAADINNDLLTDLITLDMLPDDDAIRKQSAGEDSYEVFQHKLSYGFHYQFSRNALQLNRGNDPYNNPLFSDIAPYAGVEATDWSWASLCADFDNDGWKDLFITNGILRRPNDMDYISYITGTPSRNIPDAELIRKMPEGKVPNRIFKNLNGYRFKDMTGVWMEATPDCAQGAAYADLDLDGDLDIVVNVQNQPAVVYRNNTQTNATGFLRLRLHGMAGNTFGIGAKVFVYAAGHSSVHELVPSRGWQSAVEPVVHVGFGPVQSVDSLVVHWPDGKRQHFRNLPINQTLDLYYTDNEILWKSKTAEMVPLYHEIKLDGLDYVHRENDYSAISAEPLLPYVHTTIGPPMAVADINNDGIEDIFIGGGAGQPGAIYLQQANGRFWLIKQPALELDADAEDTAAAFADINNDGYVDLIVAGGGQQFQEKDYRLNVRLYLNKGKGRLERKREAFSEVFANASVISVMDFNRDGLPDVFIGGQVTSGQFGKIPSSYLLQNVGNEMFKDVTLFSFGKHALGHISSAVWVDVNRDNLTDLIMAGHWMPITVFIQQADGRFADKTEAFGLADTQGLWNTLAVHDFNKDNLPDLIAGNLGINSRLRAFPNRPLMMYISDFDGNGSEEQVLMYNLPDKSAVFLTRDQLVRQIPSLKRKFLHYKTYSTASLSELFTEEEIRRASILRAEVLESMILKNTGGAFEKIQLPAEAQFFPVYACETVDTPAHTELILAGNLTAVQPELGYLDAGYGLAIQIDEHFKMKVLPHPVSGLIMRGEARAIRRLLLTGNGLHNVYIIARNNRSLIAFKRI